MVLWWSWRVDNHREWILVMATLPTIPTLSPNVGNGALSSGAGYVVTVADMNNMAACASFALAKPVCRVHATSTQAITSTTLPGTPVNYQAVDQDPDGMYSGSNPGRLTIQTPGFYKARYMCNAGSFGVNAGIQITTGPNNPAGAGNTVPSNGSGSWPSYTLGTTDGACSGGGILQTYLFAGDYVQACLVRPAGSMTTAITDVGSWLSLEWVSI
jgi:hypothetical protein